VVKRVIREVVIQEEREN